MNAKLERLAGFGGFKEGSEVRELSRKFFFELAMYYFKLGFLFEPTNASGPIRRGVEWAKFLFLSWQYIYWAFRPN